VRTVVSPLVGGRPVEELVRLTGGASRATWRCRVGDERLVVQRQRPEAERDMSVEARVLAAAAEAGVPVPELVAVVPADHDPEGVATLVTRQVDGETIARRILRDERFAVARAALTGQLGRALARLHTIDPATVPGVESDDPLDEYRARLDEIGEPHPAFELGFRWLERNRSDAGRSASAVVHGDFRLGNLIVDEGGLAAVIDWELVHRGDPIEDLGWLCVPTWRFGSSLPAAGVGARDDLLAAYADESGADVDPDALRWWEIAGILKWGIICVMQADTHRSGVQRSHELAAIGRRVCETEHDLFLALDGRW
jgi:aminoglycoside phosphotransferase (APT) family kinase protein